MAASTCPTSVEGAAIHASPSPEGGGGEPAHVGHRPPAAAHDDVLPPEAGGAEGPPQALRLRRGFGRLAALHDDGGGEGARHPLGHGAVGDQHGRPLSQSALEQGQRTGARHGRSGHRGGHDPGRGAAIHDRISRGGVGGLPRFEPFVEAGPVGGQRPREPVLVRPLPGHIGRDVEPHGDRAFAEARADGRIEHGAPAQGDDGRVVAVEGGQGGGPLPGAEAGLAVGGEDRGHGPARLLLDALVDVDQRPALIRGQDARHRGLPGPHVPDEGQGRTGHRRRQGMRSR